MACCSGPPEYLYVILPYFNYCGFKRRRELFVQFVNEIRPIKNIRIIVSELQGPAPLPNLDVWRQVSFPQGDSLWLKENLVNLAVPKEARYLAWIDADITFLNKNWVHDTLDELQTNDVVQMWRSAINLGPSGECIKTDKSFGYMFKGSGTPWVPTDRYGFWHPGYAWACTRSAWQKMGGLIDWAILGSGDRHMAMAFAGQVLSSAPGNIHQNYKNLLLEFQTCVWDFKVSWVEGTIIHHWHGSLENRKYRERWEILTKNAFDPLKDVGHVKSGLIQLSESGRRLEKFLARYFLDRSEDS